MVHRKGLAKSYDRIDRSVDMEMSCAVLEKDLLRGGIYFLR